MDRGANREGQGRLLPTPTKRKITPDIDEQKITPDTDEENRRQGGGCDIPPVAIDD
ncbi:hypothetical protein H6P81_009592 [Aristolochia fimbriata]|uniref:Uncharacterized protein n=1 Tax=Aristolochia fimbriata TaxID=158543 RepID=A0AAV7EPG9_ARIFI|nr:hypothetical protein H6P81_009592 [Aristolochia fimbriata]